MLKIHVDALMTVAAAEQRGYLIAPNAAGVIEAIEIHADSFETVQLEREDVPAEMTDRELAGANRGIVVLDQGKLKDQGAMKLAAMGKLVPIPGGKSTKSRKVNESAVKV